MQCTVRTLLNRKRLSRGHKNSEQIYVDSDNRDSTRLTKQSTNHKGQHRINAFAGEKQEELSRDQTSTVIAFITLEVTAR